MGTGSDFLFARPSFWSGIARLLDLWGAFDDYNRSRTPVEADRRALYSDWYIVGQDILAASEQFEGELEDEHSKQGELFGAAAPATP